MCGAKSRRLDDILRKFESKNNNKDPILEPKPTNKQDNKLVFHDAQLTSDPFAELGWQLYDKAEDMGSMAEKLHRCDNAHKARSQVTHRATLRNELCRAYTLPKFLRTATAGMILCRHLILEHSTRNLEEWCVDVWPTCYVHQHGSPTK